MAVSRAAIIDGNLVAFVTAHRGAPKRVDIDSPVRFGTSLSAREALALFEAQLESRTLDLLARELKVDGQSFYTISSAGHEGNCVLAAHSTSRDLAFLHYRSGAFFCARAAQTPGPEGPLDVLMGMVACADEPIAGGRHKVFGSKALGIPPQTSTIASQLPKALGYAVSIDRKAKLEGRKSDAISIVTMGDASSNHASSVTAINATCWSSHQNVPTPLLIVCEDNGLGISVRTPEGWVEANYSCRRNLKYFQGNALDLPDAYDAAKEAIEFVRTHRKPAFLHLKTVRLMGHAGSDVEILYRTQAEIEQAESTDPLLYTASLLLSEGWVSPKEMVNWIGEIKQRLSHLATEAVRRKKIETAEQVMSCLYFEDEQTTALVGGACAPESERLEVFRNRLPELTDRGRHFAVQMNRCLHDVLLHHKNALLFGEDVARKGGVYHVTAELAKRFGVGRVFNSLLDETSILGMAIGAGHAGFLALPEIQYLAYLMNAIDQLRGEAASLQFFSAGQFSNPMVIRIASLAYQKGFGGHFHNDNGIAALLEIPGMLIGCPARGDDAVRMYRTMVGAAVSQGRVCAFLEPIALYMTKDLLEVGDGKWLTQYPAPGDTMPIGEIKVYGEGIDLCIATFANGLWMSLRVAERLRQKGHRVRIVDLRWISPLPISALVQQAEQCKQLLIVDECREMSGIADHIAANVAEELPQLPMKRVTGRNTFIPLGAAANLVLVQENDIESAALSMLENS